MAWTRYQYVLAVTMVVTGSINTLSTKWADNSAAIGTDSNCYEDEKENPCRHSFAHPFLQAVFMFIGEFFCLLVFKFMVYYQRAKHRPIDIGPQNFYPFIMLPPAMCDMTGTSLMYIGLTLTNASSFQMLRGSIIIFTGLLSVAFLGRKLKTHHWLGMFCVCIGLVIVGVADILLGSEDMADRNGIIAGDLIIITAQIISATQMVIEEKFVSKYDVPPLQAVGWEGFFGFSILSVLLVPMYYINATGFSELPSNRLEDAIDGFVQLANNPIILVAVLGNVISIAFFNFAGISVTKELSATTRMILDSLRTIVIWAVSLVVRWEKVNLSLPVELVGFFLLLTGTCIYNDIVFAPFLRRKGCLSSDGRPELLINTGDDDESSSEDEQTPILRNQNASVQYT